MGSLIATLATEATSTSGLARFLITGGIAVGAFLAGALGVLLLVRLLRRRPTVALRAVAAGVGVVLAVVVVAVFQPQKLWIDDVVIDADPFAVTLEPDPASEGPSPSEPTEVPEPTEASEVEEPDDMDTQSPEPTMEPVGPVVLSSGEFISRDHPTSGSALLIELEDGSRILRLEDFATDNGPALQVYLTTAGTDAPHGAFDDDFVHLGALKGNIGDQNYDVPDGVDLTPYTTVVIWCDPFNVAFGAAALA